MSPTDHLFLFCLKRHQRLSVSVCIFWECKHLRENMGMFECRFRPAAEKRLDRRKK